MSVDAEQAHPVPVPDDLHIDEEGSPSAKSQEARTRLAQSAGSWKLLESNPELLLGLRARSDGLMAELKTLDPAGAVLAGDLAEMQPSDLLNFLHQGRRTGILLTRSDGAERGIVLLDGNVAWACSTSPGERLGELLCRTGLAERAKVEAALRDQVEGPGQHRRLGQLLVDSGVLGSDEVFRGLRHQVVEIFLGLLVTRAGTFVFLRGFDKARLPAMLALDTQALLLDGLRRLDEMELYRTKVVDSEVRPRRSARPVLGVQFEGESAQILSLCDGTRTIAELASLTALGDFEATKATYRLLAAGYLELDRPAR